MLLTALLFTAMTMDAAPVEVEVSLLGCLSSWSGAGTHQVSTTRPALIFIQTGDRIAGILSLSQSEPLGRQVNASLFLTDATQGLKGGSSPLQVSLPASSATHLYEFPTGCHLEVQNKSHKNNSSNN